MSNGTSYFLEFNGKRRIVFTDPSDFSYVVETLQAHAARGEALGLTIAGSADPTLECLKELPFLTDLNLNRWKGDDLSALRRLSALKCLYMGEEYGAIDFADFPELEVLHAQWSKKWRGLGALTKLRMAQLHGVKTRDIAELDIPHSVRNLRILKGSIECLNGIDSLTSLRSLSLAHTSKLENLAEVEKLSKLRRLQLSSLKRIKDYKCLGALDQLLEIDLDACAPLKTLGWLHSFHQLVAFFLTVTKVDDKDLRVLKQLPSLIWVHIYPLGSYPAESRSVIAEINERSAKMGCESKVDAAFKGLMPPGCGDLESDWAETSHLQ